MSMSVDAQFAAVEAELDRISAQKRAVSEAYDEANKAYDALAEKAQKVYHETWENGTNDQARETFYKALAKADGPLGVAHAKMCAETDRLKAAYTVAVEKRSKLRIQYNNRY